MTGAVFALRDGMKHYALAALLCLGACRTLPYGPSLDVAERLTWDAPPTIVVRGLDPDTAYTLELERISPGSQNATERSRTLYTTDDRGRIDTSLMTADDDDELGAYAPIRKMSRLDEPLNDLAPGRLRIRVQNRAGEDVLERVVGIGPNSDALVETSFDSAFPGAYIMKRKDASGPRPALVVLGGSEGNDGGSRSVAPIYAEAGFTVLGLPYYSPAWGEQPQKFPGLPRAFAELPVDYLEDAVTALRRREDVDPDHILLNGGSKGAEYVLLAGSLIPDDSPGGGFCAIVADVPSDVVWEGWGRSSDDRYPGFSWRNVPLPFVPYEGMGRVFDPEDDYTMTEAHENGRLANPDHVEAARIRVEAIDEPVLVIGGDKDLTWASGAMARRIKATRDAAGLETEAYIHPEAGHAVGGSPLRRTRRADNDARRENFPATMDFLRRHAERDDCRN